MLDQTPDVQAETEWGPSPARDGQLVSLADFVAALKRSFWIIAACVLIATVLGAAYAIETPAGYVASAQLMIEPAKQQLLWQDSNMVDLTVDNAQVESQVEILRSERIANDVINLLQLTNDPEFRSDAAASDYERHRIALSRFKNALSTRRIGQSYVIEISFRSTDPEKAARITNAITQAYMRDQLRAKTEVAQQASQWLQERVSELGAELNAAAAAVQKFRAANGITDNGSNNQLRLLDKLTELEARAQAYRKLYESFVQKLTENRQQESYPVSNSRVIASASTPLAKSYPKTKLIVLLSVLLGLLAGAAIAAARSILDGSVRTVRQIRRALGLDCLASLPRFRIAGRNAPAKAYRQIIDDPFSRFTEGVRSIKLSLQGANPNGPGLRVGVISLRPGEGKSTVAVSLAALFAGSGAKTVLVDADFRDSSLSRGLVPGAKRGIIEALAGDPDGTIVFERETAVHVLPVVGGEHVGNSADLLASPAMRRLLQALGESFSAVIVDLPSLASVIDARAMGPLLDGCILVIEWGRTPLESLAEAVELLRAGRIRLLGAVLNKVADGVPTPFGALSESGGARGATRYQARPATAES